MIFHPTTKTIILCVFLFPCFIFTQKKAADDNPGEYIYLSAPSPEGLRAARHKNKVGFLDKKGKIAIPFKYEVLYIQEELKDSANWTAIVKINRKYGVIDQSGKEITAIKYDSISNFDDSGYIAVILKGKSALVDRKGLLTPVKYDEIIGADYKVKSEYVDKNSMIYHAVEDRFFDDFGLCMVNLKGKFGFINKNGEEAIPLIYNYATYFNDSGFSTISIYDKLGIINEKGKEVIPAKYDEIISLDEFGFKGVKLYDKWGVINEKCEEITSLKYDTMTSFDKAGFAEVELNGKWGKIDRNGKEYWEKH